MKNIIWAILFISSCAFAQDREDQIESLRGVQTADFGEKLVKLAWLHNPEAEVAEHTVKMEEYDVKIANSQWLDIFSVQGNLNEFNIDESQDQFNRSDFFPRYNVAARVSLGMFISIPATMKRNREEVKIARAQKEGLKQALRSQVLQLYYNFLMYDKIYSLQSKLLLGAESSQDLNEEKFTGGEISFEEYNASQEAYNQKQIAFYQAEAAYKNAKVQLEELIGMRLEEVQ